MFVSGVSSMYNQGGSKTGGAARGEFVTGDSALKR